jgi:hypothetical protein
MGFFVSDNAATEVGYRWRSRFRNGGPLQEMVVIHKEFGLFSGKYSLKQALRILHIVPNDFDERRRWFVFLDKLKDYASDQEGVSGHDRIMKAYRENLESDAPVPVYTTTHRAADDKRVTVTRSRPILHEEQDYIVISIPTTPGSKSA